MLKWTPNGRFSPHLQLRILCIQAVAWCDGVSRPAPASIVRRVHGRRELVGSEGHLLRKHTKKTVCFLELSTATNGMNPNEDSPRQARDKHTQTFNLEGKNDISPRLR
jgi:hypothetical protein